jgi:glutamate decarboxylase
VAAESIDFDKEIETAAPGAFLTKDAPRDAIPDGAMPPVAAMRLVQQELAVEGIPERNLATFVTTFMEPEARVVIDENLHRNFIDHAEYPITAEIEQRCIRMLAELFHAPGETTGARTQGSSEAIMLGALSLKWKWRERREADGKPTDQPNLVFGGDVHVVWEKFCRYFDVEPRIVPLQAGKYTIGPEDVEPHVDENTIGVAAVVGTTFTGHADDVVGINDLLPSAEKRERHGCPPPYRWRERGLRLALSLSALRVGLPPRAGPLDQRLGSQVRDGLSGDRLVDLPGEIRPRRGSGLRGELPRQDR